MATNRQDMPQHYFTLDEYFALEQASDARWEYWDGEIVCMSGGKRQHYLISSNVHYRLSQQLGNGPCRAFTGETPIWTPTLPPYRYPDASVACGELRFQPIHGVDALINPVLIVEVLSPSTEAADRGNKFAHYRRLESLREYVLVAQDQVRVERYTRQGDEWRLTELSRLEETLQLESIGCAVALSRIYAKVLFAGDGGKS